MAGWSKRHRHVTTKQRHRVFARYGIPYSRHSHYEFDHLISLEIGGDNSDRNLWPEPLSGRRGAHSKDKEENRLHHAVCSGDLTLRAAQRQIVRAWAR